MGAVGQVYYKVVIPGNGDEPISTGPDIYSNIVAGYGASRFTKLGVQAPPGTIMVFNEPDNPKEIMVGRTGIYELDDDIVITSLRFLKPKKYELDVGASTLAKQGGVQAIKQAEADRAAALAEEGQPAEKGDNDEAYWQDYERIQNDYNTAYEKGLIEYHKGLNGIYKLPNPDDPEAPENYDDVYNVIVDFIYE